MYVGAPVFLVTTLGTLSGWGCNLDPSSWLTVVAFLVVQTASLGELLLSLLLMILFLCSWQEVSELLTSKTTCLRAVIDCQDLHVCDT